MQKTEVTIILQYYLENINAIAFASKKQGIQ